jgi:hypothetical protein
MKMNRMYYINPNITIIQLHRFDEKHNYYIYSMQVKRSNEM